MTSDIRTSTRVDMFFFVLCFRLLFKPWNMLIDEIMTDSVFQSIYKYTESRLLRGVQGLGTTVPSMRCILSESAIYSPALTPDSCIFDALQANHCILYLSAKHSWPL